MPGGANYRGERDDNYRSYTPPTPRQYNVFADSSLNKVSLKTQVLKDLMIQELESQAKFSSEQLSLFMSVWAKLCDSFAQYNDLSATIKAIGTTDHLGKEYLRKQLHSIFTNAQKELNFGLMSILMAVYGTVKKLHGVKIESIETYQRQYSIATGWSMEQYVSHYLSTALNKSPVSTAAPLLKLIGDYVGYNEPEPEYNLVLRESFPTDLTNFPGQYLLVNKDPEQLYYVDVTGGIQQVAIVDDGRFRRTLLSFTSGVPAGQPVDVILLNTALHEQLITSNGGHQPEAPKLSLKA